MRLKTVFVLYALVLIGLPNESYSAFEKGIEKTNKPKTLAKKRKSRRSLNSLTCSDYDLIANQAMKKNNIFSISSSLNNDGNVEVRQRGGLGEKSSFLGYFIHANDNLLDWKNLTGEVWGDEVVETDECLMGKAVIAYIKAMENGAFSNVKWKRMEVSTLLFELKSYFLVDRFGVDQVVNKSSTLEPYKFKRVYGTTTNFSVNDETRIGTFNTLAQNLGLVGSLKNSKTDEVFLDAHVGRSLFNFKYNTSLSKKYSVKIWVGDIDEHSNEIICLKWAGDHRDKNCSQYSKPINRKASYIVSDFGAAKHLFESLSTPNKSNSKTYARGCPSGVFCDFPGGEYIHAIYEGNFSKYRKIDRKYLAALIQKKNDMVAEEVRPIFDLFGLNRGEEYSLLNYFTDQYLKNYKDNPPECFDDGGVDIKFSKEIPDTVYINGYGSEVGRSGGFSLYGEYKINREFVGVCKNVCGVDGFGPFIIGGFDAAYNKNRINKVMQGLTKLRQNHNCKSNAVKQFERNLIRFQKLQSEQLYFQRNSD